jgi:rhodanese-related sulfurtransferase
MSLKKGFKTLLAEAEAEIRTLNVAEARTLHGREDVVFVDLRDPRELAREGKVPGAFHAPRGMLEFWIDPDSPYYKDIFTPGKTFVFYCQSGWRSALATRTVQDMGLPDVCHIAGGYRAWKESGAPTEPLPERHA